MTEQPSKNRKGSALVNRLLDKRKIVPTPSIFGLHHDHHKNAQVDTTSFQAKRLGLKYLGFGRYGKVRRKMSNEADDSSPNYMVTHIVRNGLLVPVTGETEPNENDYFPKRNERFTQSYFKKQAEVLEKEINSYKGTSQKMLFKSIAALLDYVGDGYSPINKVLFSGLEHNAHPKIIHKIRALDHLFEYEFTKLHADMPVYTGTSVKLEKGKPFIFRGFLSTTIEPKVAVRFLGGSGGDDDDEDNTDIDFGDEDDKERRVPTLIQIDMKKGQRALDVNSLIGGSRDEYEFVLPRNSRIVVTDGPIYLKHAVVWRAELDQTDDDFDDTEIDLA